MLNKIEEALEDIKNGKMVIVVDEDKKVLGVMDTEDIREILRR